MHATPRSGPHQATPVRPIPPWPTGPNQRRDSPAERLRGMDAHRRQKQTWGRKLLSNRPFVLATGVTLLPLPLTFDRCEWSLTPPTADNLAFVLLGTWPYLLADRQTSRTDYYTGAPEKEGYFVTSVALAKGPLTQF